MKETQEVKIVTADPSAIGLFGLAVITLVASSQKLGITQGVSLIIPWALFLGALAQLVASANDFKHNNTFGATAFGAYGFFWLGVAFTWLIQNGIFGEKLAKAADPKQLGFAFLAYLIFTIFMTIGAMETHKVLFLIFFFIDFLFLGLSLSTLGIAPEFGHELAAYSELIISLLSFYGSAASVLNNHFGRVFLPVGKPFGIFKK
ncbi:succinate-acetate transporter protein [Clostridium punense]|uniref:Succinate-acetate transporter protein n=1 Tax=Clostridium punense TaxID=1054297 RepID=A0ABS4K0B9_9CLOT|nr:MULTISPECIES: GPR1/FUN34/YaaH family transporter [Clostridium]EQB90238.1 membrane protein [Clostridium sp. BL8]MBP2021213.1 succinate-acetate transporter protein [Clostridium punense]